MNCSLFFPPQWSPLSPHCAPTSIAAQLKHAGHNVYIRDLNIEFYRYILTEEYINASIKKALELEPVLKNDIAAEYAKIKNPNDLSREYKLKAKKYLELKELNENIEETKKTFSYLPTAIEILKDKEDFYSLEMFSKAIYVIDTALYFNSVLYFPCEFTMYDFKIPPLKFDLNNILRYCTDKSLNMFNDFYEVVLPSLIEEKSDYIGISIGSSSQVIPGLTLAMLLKAKTNAHINIGGNYFSRVVDSILNCKEFLEYFADSMIIEEGEKPITELLRYLNNEISIKDVPNLIYLDKDGNTKINPKAPPLKLNELAIQSLDGFLLDKYLMPEIVLPILSSRGCYWKKCTFCDHDFGQTYNVKSVEKLIDEIKELNQKYGISHFEFSDEAISAHYVNEFSSKVIESGLKINWYCNFRLETSLTKDILMKAREAGLRMVMWGVETGSDRIMRLINKGIDFDKRLEILKNASDADIWNYAYIFFGFPTETHEDAANTINMIRDNTDIIHSFGMSKFALGRHALLNKNPEEYGLIKLPEREEPFAFDFPFIIKNGLSPTDVNNKINYLTTSYINDHKNPAWMHIRYRETLFLYICKYGKKNLEQMSLY